MNAMEILDNAIKQAVFTIDHFERVVEDYPKLAEEEDLEGHLQRWREITARMIWVRENTPLSEIEKIAEPLQEVMAEFQQHFDNLRDAMY